MCIAIYKPEGKLISQETLAQCYKANSDGAGYMFHKNDKLYVKKGFFSFDDFWKSYRRDKNKECVIHFRIKTHGLINEANCHPYKVNDNFAFVHNGMISGYTDPNKSDTWLFNEDVIQPFVNKWGNLGLFEDPIKKLIEARIGYSKLIFMDNQGNSKIFNEDKGTWDDGVWYSNSSYKKPAPYVPPPAPVALPYTPYENRYFNKHQTWGYKTQNIAVGELVSLTWGHYDRDTKEHFKKDTIWEIIAVNNGYTVDLMSDSEDINDDTPKFIYNIRFSDFELLEDEPDPVGLPTTYPNGGWSYHE
jgi:glutamine amidotransferase